MAPQNSYHIAKLLSSRLCHDLVTPIGAINTGLELFQENMANLSKDSREIMDLIRHSAEAAAARLSFFRMAFGTSGDQVSFGEARALIETYFARSKISLHWETPFLEDLMLKKWGRLLLNATLWLSECAPKGGEIHFIIPDETSLFLSLHLVTNSIVLHQGTLEALEGKALLTELTPRTVPCYLIHSLVEELKGKLEIRQSGLPTELLLEIKGNEEAHSY